MKEDITYAEIDEILNLIEEEYVNRIPDKIRTFFRENRSREYNPVIKPDISLLEQNIRRETILLLAMLNLKYWCDSEEEKKAVLKELSDNDRERQKELEEKYDWNRIFNEDKVNRPIENNIVKNEIIEYKERSFIQKIIDKIMKLIKR